jgi:hypothetical protein
MCLPLLHAKQKRLPSEALGAYDHQPGRQGFAEKPGAVDQRDGDERAKPGKL